MTKQEREAFEEWAKEQGHDVSRRGDWYGYKATTEAAEAWHESWQWATVAERQRCAEVCGDAYVAAQTMIDLAPDCTPHCTHWESIKKAVGRLECKIRG